MFLVLLKTFFEFHSSATEEKKAKKGQKTAIF